LAKQILYLHGRPYSHILHKGLANSLGVVPKFVDEKYRWQDQGFGVVKNLYAWIVNAVSYKSYRSFDYLLVDGLHFSPVIAKKLGILPERIKIISHMGNQLPYFMLSGKLSFLSKALHQWLFRNYDYLFCEGKMILEMIKEVNPGIKTPLLPVFTAPSSYRIEALRNLKPALSGKNMITIAAGPGEGRVFYKGLDIMIDAFVLASKKEPLLSYYILGEWSVEDIKNLTCKYNADEIRQLYFAGNQPEMMEYLNYLENSDLCIHVARGDAFPGSTIEAMHAGIPILISNYTGTKEILESVNSNLIVNLTVNNVADAVLAYMNLSMDERKDLSVKLKEAVIQYSEDNAIKHYREAFEKIHKNEKNNL